MPDASVPKIDVMIIAFNEALNLPHCLRALSGWANKVFVIDSGSTDGSQEIARAMGARVIEHEWEGYARQKNWGLTNLPFDADWLLIVDADEVITGALAAKLLANAAKSPEDVPENGFFINRLTYFLDRPLYHGGYFPSWNMRFFKRGKGVYEDREVHEHIMIDDPLGYIREPMLHNDRRGLEHYVAKHNRYSTLEARATFGDIMRGRSKQEVNLTKSSRRRRWLKRHVMPRVPFPGLWRFLYMYILRMGALDGRAGLEFCKFISIYDSLVVMKLRALMREKKTLDRRARREAARSKKRHEAPSAASAGMEPAMAELRSVPASTQAALAVAEGTDPVTPEALREAEMAMDADEDGAAGLVGGLFASTAGGEPTQMHPESSPWTFREKLGRALWMLVGKPIFRISFHNWYGFRARLLRLFGAKIGSGVALRPSVNIEVPWMITIDDDATVGDHAILYSLGMITIGRRSIISQYAHLCAGTHDYTDHTFKLIRTPITIGQDVWIGADAFIGPGVVVHDLSVVGARSSAYKELDAHQVYVGNPAKPVKDRVLK